MTTTSPITDIHAAEEAAKKKIEQAKSNNVKKLSQTKDKEEAKLNKLEGELRAAGKEKITTAKKEAAVAADEKLKSGKANDESMMKVAHGKMEEAVKEGIEAFKEHIGV